MTAQSVDEFVHRPQFASCDKFNDSYSLWSCRENIWNTKFRGKTVDHVRYPDNRFSAVFFQPFYAGQTFGLGQLNPLTALEMTDMVHRISGLPKLDDRDGRKVYKTIMDPDTTLPYIAAIIKTSIDRLPEHRRLRHFRQSGPDGDALQYRRTEGARSKACSGEPAAQGGRPADPISAGELLRLVREREDRRLCGLFRAAADSATHQERFRFGSSLTSSISRRNVPVFHSVDRLCKQVGQFGRLRRETRRIDDHARV